eukprot:g1312.t1
MDNFFSTKKYERISSPPRKSKYRKSAQGESDRTTSSSLTSASPLDNSHLLGGSDVVHHSTVTSSTKSPFDKSNHTPLPIASPNSWNVDGRRVSDSDSTVMNPSRTIDPKKLSGRRVAYYILLVQGCGMLFPWNTFVTAANYFSVRFEKSPFQNNFLSWFGVAFNLSTLTGLMVATRYQYKLPQRMRVMVPMAITFVIFFLTTIEVLLPEFSGNAMFALTIIAVVIAGLSNAMLTGGIFGLVGRFPSQYMQAVMNGQGLAGVLISISAIVSTAMGAPTHGLPTYEQVKWGAFIYFATSLLVILLCIVTYKWFERLPITKYYGGGNSNTKTKEGSSPIKKTNRFHNKKFNTDTTTTTNGLYSETPHHRSTGEYGTTSMTHPSSNANTPPLLFSNPNNLDQQKRTSNSDDVEVSEKKQEHETIMEDNRSIESNDLVSVDVHNVNLGINFPGNQQSLISNTAIPREEGIRGGGGAASTSASTANSSYGTGMNTGKSILSLSSPVLVNAALHLQSPKYATTNMSNQGQRHHSIGSQQQHHQMIVGGTPNNMHSVGTPNLHEDRMQAYRWSQKNVSSNENTLSGQKEEGRGREESDTNTGSTSTSVGTRLTSDYDLGAKFLNKEDRHHDDHSHTTYVGHHNTPGYRNNTAQDGNTKISISNHDERYNRMIERILKNGGKPDIWDCLHTIWREFTATSLTFFITLCIFPSITTKITSVNNPHNWVEPPAGRFYGDIWVPFLILCFNAGDWGGRIAAGNPNFRMTNSNVVLILAILRLFFIPLFIACNVHVSPGTPSALQKKKKNDYVPILTMLVFSFSNGFLATSALMNGPPRAEDIMRENAMEYYNELLHGHHAAPMKVERNMQSLKNAKSNNVSDSDNGNLWNTPKSRTFDNVRMQRKYEEKAKRLGKKMGELAGTMLGMSIQLGLFHGALFSFVLLFALCGGCNPLDLR